MRELELHGDNRRDNLMARPSKALINKGFWSLKLSEIRSQGSETRKPVLQEITVLLPRMFKLPENALFSGSF